MNGIRIPEPPGPSGTFAALQRTAPTLVTTDALGVATTTSIVIAMGTDLQHKNVLELIRNNLADFEEFGGVAFETRPFQTAGGTQRQTFAVLTEEHATLLMTYLRNSPVVRDFKKRLVHAFYELRRSVSTTVAAVPRTYAEALRAAADEAEARERAEAERDVANARAAELEEPAAAWANLADLSGDYDVADAAKILSRDPNIQIGRDRLFAFMAGELEINGRSIGNDFWIYRGRRKRWKAYQDHVDLGRLKHRPSAEYFHKKSGTYREGDPVVVITVKGISELHRRMGGSLYSPPGGQLVLV